MKNYSVALQNDVVSSYDKTKTYKAGRVDTRTLPAPYNTKTVLSSPLSKFIDVYTDTLAGFIPGYMFASPNGRLFILQSVPASGSANQIAMYNFNTTTGAYSYVGRIAFTISGPAPTVRSFHVDDSNTSNIKIFFSLTSTTVNTAGAYMINKVSLSNFLPVGFPTFYTALSNDTAAVYQLQLNTETGGANLLTTAAGAVLPIGTVDSQLLNKYFVHNGVSATHQYYVFDYSIAPLLTSLGTSTVTAPNTTGASTTFTMAGNTLAIGDQVVITSNAPTGYTVSTAIAAQTIYYVVATNFVAGSTFSLSATFGGAIVSGSSAVSNTTFSRALGQTNSLSVCKTANLPALAGTLLAVNSENHCIPQSGANSGQECAFFTSTTTSYLGRLKDLFSFQSGTLNNTINVTGLTSTANLVVGQTVFGTGIPATTTIASIVSGTAITLSNAATVSGSQNLTFGAILWTNLINSNVLGTGLDYQAPTPVYSLFMSTIDSSVYTVSGIISLVKKFVNSVVHSNIGQSTNSLLEGQNHITDQFALSAIAGIESRDGWLFASSLTAGQRGIVAFDIRSDWKHEYSYIVTPIQKTGGYSVLKDINTIELLYDYTAGSVFFYRTAATESDPIFNTASGGWVMYAKGTDAVLQNYTQFKVAFALSGDPFNTSPSITTPPQIVDVCYTLQRRAEMSDKWSYSYQYSSPLVPTRVGFEMRETYSSAVPKLYFRAFQKGTSNLITEANTVDNAANFNYSTDGGVTSLPLGTIPNTLGTKLRYTYTNPPGMDIDVVISEE